MPTAKVQAYTSGAAGLLWNENAMKKGKLTGLTIDNQSAAPNTIKLYDCFTTLASVDGSAGSAVDAENLGTLNALSGKVRLQVTVPQGETVKLSEQDCREIEFIGKAVAIAGAETADCVVIAQYILR